MKARARRIDALTLSYASDIFSLNLSGISLLVYTMLDNAIKTSQIRKSSLTQSRKLVKKGESHCGAHAQFTLQRGPVMGRELRAFSSLAAYIYV